MYVSPTKTMCSIIRGGLFSLATRLGKDGIKAMKAMNRGMMGVDCMEMNGAG